MSSYWVSFTPCNDCLNVTPPFREGQRDGIWVTAKSIGDAAQKAKWKMAAGYGVEIEDIDVGGIA